MKTKIDVCRFFGCSMEQLNNQYKKNAEGLNQMKEKAIRTGKKVNGYTAEELDFYTKKYQYLSVAEASSNISL